MGQVASSVCGLIRFEPSGRAIKKSLMAHEDFLVGTGRTVTKPDAPAGGRLSASAAAARREYRRAWIGSAPAAVLRAQNGRCRDGAVPRVPLLRSARAR